LYVKSETSWQSEMNQPIVKPDPGRNRYILMEDYIYKDIRIPSGFIFDGASVPKLFQFISTPFHPDVMAAAIVHDWLYVNHQTDRKAADIILYDLLVANGIRKFKAKLMYKAVRVGGVASWGYNTEDINKLTILYILCKDNADFEAYHFPKDYNN